MSPILVARGVQKRFVHPAGTVKVLKGVELAVQRGEFVAIVGESGAGKSTLLQILAGLEPLDAGEVLIEGENIAAMNDDAAARLRNRKIGFVYQFHHLVPELSALENAMLPLLVQGVREDEARKRAQALLAELGLGARLFHRPAELSGGEAQRVAIARALVARPALLLADEPTGNLDERTAEHVFALFREAARRAGAAVVMATHSLKLAQAADRAMTLAGGVLIAGIQMQLSENL